MVESLDGETWRDIGVVDGVDMSGLYIVSDFGRIFMFERDYYRKDGVKVRIVSAPSEGLFRNQSKEYQESVLPANAKIFGLTAGLPVTLQGLVGCHGKVWGLESFGFSAPYKVLDEKLGFTADNVYKQVKTLLNK